MSAERAYRRPGGPVAVAMIMAIALIATPLLATAQNSGVQKGQAKQADAKQEDAFDFEAAGGAAAAGPMHRAAVIRIAAHCSEKVPDTASLWRETSADWDTRNAAWLVASERVLVVAMRKLREQNEDADAVRGMLDGLVDEFAGRSLDEVRKQVEGSSVAEVCFSMRTAIAGGQFDVETNGYTKAIDLLRTYLPAEEAEKPAR
jgi:hypothetical protein